MSEYNKTTPPWEPCLSIAIAVGLFALLKYLGTWPFTMLSWGWIWTIPLAYVLTTAIVSIGALIAWFISVNRK